MFSFFKKKLTKPTPLIVPRIKHTNFLAAVESIPGMSDASRPVAEPLVGDLLLTYAIDIGPSYVSVTPASLPEHDLRSSDLRQLAHVNGLQAMRNTQVRTDGIVHELTAPDNMAACSVLYPELWQQIEREAGSPLVVAFPHRDFVLYAKADSEGVAALARLVDQVDFDDTHALVPAPLPALVGGLAGYRLLTIRSSRCRIAQRFNAGSRSRKGGAYDSSSLGDNRCDLACCVPVHGDWRRKSSSQHWRWTDGRDRSEGVEHS